MQQSFSGSRYIPAGMIAILLLAGIPAVMADTGTSATSSAGGTIVVMSFPEGAAVYLNDEYQGIAPQRIEHIPPGKYLVNVSKAGYNNNSVPVILFDGSYREIGFNLETFSSAPAKPTGSGSIAVDSNPGGAFVMLDGNNVGITPPGRAALILNNVPAGSHTITVDLAGYTPNTGTVTVARNQVVRVNADLETPAPALPGTSPATTNRKEPVPLSPVTGVAAACLAGLAAMFRRS